MQERVDLDLGDASALEGSKRGVGRIIDSWLALDEALRKVVRGILTVLLPLAVGGIFTAYFVNRELFAAIIGLIWSSREALLVLCLSLLGGWYIGGQARVLALESAKAVNTINIAVGKMQDAADALQHWVGIFAGIAINEKPSGPPSGGASPPDVQASASVPPYAQSEKDFWDSLSNKWRETKDLIEITINSIEDGRKYSKYARMARYDYEPIVDELVEDGLLGQEERRAFVEMKRIFNVFRTQKYMVERSDFEEFIRLKAVIEKLTRKYR